MKILTFNENKTTKLLGKQNAILCDSKEGKAIDDILAALEVKNEYVGYSSLILISMYMVSIGKVFGIREERAKINGKK